MRRIAHRFSSLLVLALVSVGAFGCSDDGGTQPTRFSATGTWIGTASGITLNVTLNDNNGTVNGSGSISSSGGSLALTVTGTRAGNVVSLTARATGFQDVNYSGTFVTQRQINGTLNGSGFNNFALTLNRQ